MGERVGEVYFDGSQEFSMFEDDGNFFVEEFGVRVWPDLPVSQFSSRREFNREVNRFLRENGYEVRYNETGTV